MEINKDDAWAVHTVAHVKEMEGKQREGIDWLNTTLPYWSNCNGLSIHNHWHRCLYYLELNQFDKVLNIYDSIMRKDSPTGTLVFIFYYFILFLLFL